MIKFKENKGLGLLEVMISLFLLSFGVIGGFAVIQKIVQFSSVNSSRLVAYHLAQEGVEVVRNVRDTSRQNHLPFDNDISEASAPIDYRCDQFPCKPQHCEIDDEYLKKENGFYLCTDAGDSDLVFRRVVSVDKAVSGESLEVTAMVEWVEKGNTYQVKTTEILYDWQ